MTTNKRTLVLGATTNPERYSNMAVRSLTRHGHEVAALGIKEGEIDGIKIETETLSFKGIDTVTLYLNPERQKVYYDYILNLEPKRIIFNPGTENSELLALAKARGIETEYACTLVLLNTGQY